MNKVTLREYLLSRYQSEGSHLGLTRKQAEYLGIPYPLIKGWLLLNGDRPVDPDEMDSRATKNIQKRTTRLQKQGLLI